jgi:hypothetical protein
MVAIQSLTRGAIRRSIGRNLGILIDGAATSTTDTSSLIDTLNLLGGDDEHNQKEVIIYDATGSIVDGETSIVDDFTGSSNDATMAPVFSASITALDKYEMWKTPWRIADIDDAINQAINEVSNKALQIKEIHTPFTETDKYLYNVLSSFTHLYEVEYVYSIGTEKTIHTCDAKWDELEDTDVTASLDTSFKKEGGGSNKLVVAAGAAAGDILLTDNITEVDLSGCTEVQIWVYSTVALAAGDLQLLLDDTASCASPVESLNIPATTANTWTRHIISLANPQSDSAIISVGIKMIVDKGAFNLWVDDVKAIDALTNVYRELPIEYWGIAKGSTNYLHLTVDGLSLVGIGTQLRLTGYRIPVRLDADATTSEVDPAYLIAQTTGRLLISHAKSSFLDIHDRASLAQYWLGQAASLLPSLSPSMPGSVRSI